MPLLELEKVKLVELVCSHNIQCQGSRLLKSLVYVGWIGIGYLSNNFQLPKKLFFIFFKRCFFFHCFMSVFISFLFLLLRFCDCGRSYAPSRGNKTLHGPMLLESRLFCSHVLRSLCFFLNNKLRCASLEICKNTVR